MRAINGSSVHKHLTGLEQDGRVVYNEHKIVEILAERCATVSNSNNCREDFLKRKDEAEQDALDFGDAENRS